eukprot:2787857-Alexandrium_andersonii.AAC.1
MLVYSGAQQASRKRPLRLRQRADSVPVSLLAGRLGRDGQVDRAAKATNVSETCEFLLVGRLWRAPAAVSAPSDDSGRPRCDFLAPGRALMPMWTHSAVTVQAGAHSWHRRATIRL